MTTSGAVSATFCATLVDEWVRAGVRHAMVAPGSRSTPLALALLRNPHMSVEIFHDERSAGFAALGVGLSSKVPAIVLCSSGTAAAHFFAAVIEADLSCVPMIVCTADRPPHLRDVAAPQTVDQTKMFGDAVRWFHDPGVPTSIPLSTWRALASRVFSSSLGVRPGPVHLNLPFDEPLFGDQLDLPPARSSRWSHKIVGNQVESSLIDDLSTQLFGRKGIFVAGKTTPHNILDLATSLGWPIFADPRSGVRCDHKNVIAAFDPLLRCSSHKDALRPDVVVCVGEPPASKVLSQWLSSHEGDIVQIHESDRVIDPLHRVGHTYVCDSTHLFDQLLKKQIVSVPGDWLQAWRESDVIAQRTIDAWVSNQWSEISVSRTLSKVLPDKSHLVVSSSMPIRDFEWFGGVLGDVFVHSNRGANGIDGVVSTAIGVAVGSRQTTFVLIGDVAFLHDSNSLLGLGARDADLRIVVTNNDGGSIFSFLPQAGYVSTDDFEKIYGTPHDVHLESLCQAHHIAYRCVTSAAELITALSETGPVVIEAKFERNLNVAQHEELNQLIVEAVSAPRV